MIWKSTLWGRVGSRNQRKALAGSRPAPCAGLANACPHFYFNAATAF